MKGFKIKSILVSMFLLLGGCSTTPMHSNQSLSSEVGTGWGGDVKSTVTGVSAERAEREPSEIILINYSAKYQPGYDRVYSIRISNLEYAVRDANFNSIPITRRYDSYTGQWQYIIPATVGMNYQLYVRNFSRDTNYEIVATVDGLDVLSGKPGSLNNSGYIVNAGDSLAIKGFRKDKHTEAAFQFSDASDSYAANSAQGDVRNTGVIGFAAFALQSKSTSALPPCSAQAFPANNNGYAPPPCRK
ncbi:hypothetical protein HV079_04710 [Citrobacter freundii]|uniref:hypothetical protein n=1 Tax=Citrobacter freundii TaxID=546 RepID=UPI0015E9726D|nr:hypothetical protein [Citrobacter freundii]QLZ58487.1 hypothetical protein HV079_04710 [Citrobacter freundii]